MFFWYYAPHFEVTSRWQVLPLLLSEARDIYRETRDVRMTLLALALTRVEYT